MTINRIDSPFNRFRCRALPVGLWLPLLCACSDIVIDGASPIECGEEICHSGEFCLVERGSPVPSGTGSIDGYSCVAIPDSVALDQICSEITEWKGQPVTACSNLNGAELQTTDVNCGDMRCSEKQYCQVQTQSGPGSAAESLECIALPDGCTTLDTACASSCRTIAETDAAMSASLCIAGSGFLFLFF
jgi:hypothetical protein